MIHLDVDSDVTIIVHEKDMKCICIVRKQNKVTSSTWKMEICWTQLYEFPDGDDDMLDPQRLRISTECTELLFIYSSTESLEVDYRKKELCRICETYFTDVSVTSKHSQRIRMNV